MLTALAMILALPGPSLGIEAPGDGCAHSELEAMAWLTGDFATTHPQSILAMGEVVIEPIWGGCALLERQSGVYESATPLGTGLGLLRFNPAEGNWDYSFAGDGVAMSAQGRYQVETGLQLEGVIHFLSDGHSRPARVSWEQIAPETIEHRIEMLDTDSGQFVPWQTLLLRPLDQTPRPRTPDHWTQGG